MMQYFRKNVRSIMLVIVVLFIISCFAGYGMYSGGNGASADNNAGGPADYAVATVNGENVMRSTMDYEMAQFIQARGLAQSISDDDLPYVRSMILDQMAIMAELDKEVTARNIAVTKDNLDATMKEIEASFPTREIFLQEIQRVGMDEKALRADVEEQMKRQAVFEQVVAPASADQQEIQSFYDTLKEYAFQKPEGFTMNIAHFTTEGAASAAQEKLKAGTAWDEVMTATASSDILNYIPYEAPVFVPVSEMLGNVEYLKDVPLNEVTGPVELTSDDFMLVVKREKQEAGTSSFDEVSADIEQMILNQKRQGLQSQFLQELRSRAAVNILDQDLIKTPEPPVVDTVTDEVVTDVSGDVVKETITETIEVPVEPAPVEEAATSADAPASGGH